MELIFFVIQLNNLSCNLIEGCEDGDVRLVGAGNSTAEGRVEYCYQGSWAPTCFLTTNTANLICKKLGYTQFSCMFYDVLDEPLI